MTDDINLLSSLLSATEFSNTSTPEVFTPEAAVLTTPTTIYTNSSNSSNLTDCHMLFYPEWDYILMGYINCVSILFGLGANLISALIFAHPSMRSSPINWYLIGISLAGTLLLSTSMMFTALPRLGERLADPSSNSPLRNNWALVRLYLQAAPVTFPLGNMGQTCGVYMTVAMSTHRFIGVCFPFKAGKILTRFRVKIIIAGVVIFAILFNATRFFEVRLVGECYHANVDAWLPEIGMTDLREELWYKTAFHGYINTFVMFIVPFVSLAIMNSCVIMAVHRSRQMHATLTGGGGSAEEDALKRQEVQKEIRTSVMLVGIVVVFIACNSLSFIVNLIENSLPMDRRPESDLEQTIHNLYVVLVAVSNFLATLNASLNLFIYCLFSEKFRLLFGYYCKCQWCREGEMILHLNEHQ